MFINFSVQPLSFQGQFMCKPNKSCSRENPRAKPQSTSRSSAARRRPRSCQSQRNEPIPTSWVEMSWVWPQKWLFNRFYEMLFFRSFFVVLGFCFFWNDRKPTYRKISCFFLHVEKQGFCLVFVIVGQKVERVPANPQNVSCFLCKPTDAPKWHQDPQWLTDSPMHWLQNWALSLCLVGKISMIVNHQAAMTKNWFCHCKDSQILN